MTMHYHKGNCPQINSLYLSNDSSNTSRERSSPVVSITGKLRDVLYINMLYYKLPTYPVISLRNLDDLHELIVPS